MTLNFENEQALLKQIHIHQAVSGPSFTSLGATSDAANADTTDPHHTHQPVSLGAILNFHVLGKRQINVLGYISPHEYDKP